MIPFGKLSGAGSASVDTTPFAATLTIEPVFGFGKGLGGICHMLTMYTLPAVSAAQPV